MGPLTVLAWIGVALAGLIVLAAVALLILMMTAAVIGIRRMREDEDKPEATIYQGRGER